MLQAAQDRQARRAQSEHEMALQERAEHIAKLRALRLAKEASERKRTAKAESEPTTPENSETEA